MKICRGDARISLATSSPIYNFIVSRNWPYKDVVTVSGLSSAQYSTTQTQQGLVASQCHANALVLHLPDSFCKIFPVFLSLLFKPASNLESILVNLEDFPSLRALSTKMCSKVFKQQYCDNCRKQPTSECCSGRPQRISYAPASLLRAYQNELGADLMSAHKIEELVPCKDTHCAYRTSGHWKYAETDKVAFINHPACVCRILGKHGAGRLRSLSMRV